MEKPKTKKDLQGTIRVPETAKWSTFVADSFVKLFMAEHLHGILAILVLNCFRGETRKEGEERVVGGGEARLKVRPVVPIATAAIRAVHNLLYQPKWKRCWCVSHDGGRQEKKNISLSWDTTNSHLRGHRCQGSLCLQVPCSKHLEGRRPQALKKEKKGEGKKRQGERKNGVDVKELLFRCINH